MVSVPILGKQSIALDLSSNPVKDILLHYFSGRSSSGLHLLFNINSVPEDVLRTS